MIRCRPILAVLLGAASLVAGSAAQADEALRVDITEGVASPLLIAIPEVRSARIPGVAEGEDIGVALSRIIRDDLIGTGLYRQVDGPQIDGAVDPDLPAWQRIGAQALVFGRPAGLAGGQISYECALFDVFASRRERTRLITVPTAEWRRAAHKCADMVFEFTTGDPGHFDTRLAYVAESGPKVGRTRQIAVADYDGANPIVLDRGADLGGSPRFSPDGRRLVYVTYAAKRTTLKLVDIAGGNARDIELPDGLVSAARFSPDGRNLALSIALGGNTDIYRYDLTNGRLQQLTNAPGIDTAPGWSPDGNRIVFESNRSGQQQIYVMNADGSAQTRLSFGSGNHGSPAWSPRGDLIAFTRVTEDSLVIGVMKADGSKERMITSGWQDEQPSWAPSGRAIAFQRSKPGDKLPELWITDLTGKVQHAVSAIGGASDPHWSGVRP